MWICLKSNVPHSQDLYTQGQKPGFCANIPRREPQFFKETGFFCVTILVYLFPPTYHNPLTGLIGSTLGTDAGTGAGSGVTTRRS